MQKLGGACKPRPLVTEEKKMTASRADHDLEQFEKNCLEFLRLYLSMKPLVEVDERGVYLSKPKKSVESKQLTKEGIIEAVLRHRPDPKTCPEGVVPQGLPEELRAHASEMTAESLTEYYQVDQAVQMVSDKRLTRLELISLHLRSYKNILELELSDQPELNRRFVRIVNKVFTDLLSRLYNTISGKCPVSIKINFHMCIHFTMCDFLLQEELIEEDL